MKKAMTMMLLLMIINTAQAQTIAYRVVVETREGIEKYHTDSLSIANKTLEDLTGIAMNNKERMVNNLYYEYRDNKITFYVQVCKKVTRKKKVSYRCLSRKESKQYLKRKNG